MLFETSHKKPAHLNGKSTGTLLKPPGLPAKPPNTVSRAVPVRPPATKQPPPGITPKKNVWPSGTPIPPKKAPAKKGSPVSPLPTPSVVPAGGVQQRKTYPGIVTKSTQKTPAGYIRQQAKPMHGKAGPTQRAQQANYNRPGAGKLGQKTTNYYQRSYKKPVTGWPFYSAPAKKVYTSTAAPRYTVPARTFYSAYRPTSTGVNQRPNISKTYQQAQTTPGTGIRARSNFSPLVKRQAYYTRGTVAPVFTKNTRPQQRVFAKGNYSKCAPFQPTQQGLNSVPQFRQTAVQKSSPDKTVCHTCGAKGCTTISRFAFNSSQLRLTHKKQIRELANRIFQQNINAVIATGHTDSSGTEDYNEALGARRSAAVIRELRKQLSLLKPNADKNLFWKIASRGERQPLSKIDTAANRRVHICIRRARF